MKPIVSAWLFFWLTIWIYLAGSPSLPQLHDPSAGGFMTADGKPYNGDITTLPVRGQDFDGFTKSVRDPKFDPDTAKQAYELYAKKDWAALHSNTLLPVKRRTDLLKQLQVLRKMPLGFCLEQIVAFD